MDAWCDNPARLRYLQAVSKAPWALLSGCGPGEDGPVTNAIRQILTAVDKEAVKLWIVVGSCVVLDVPRPGAPNPARACLNAS